MTENRDHKKINRKKKGGGEGWSGVREYTGYVRSEQNTQNPKLRLFSLMDNEMCVRTFITQIQSPCFVQSYST